MPPITTYTDVLPLRAIAFQLMFLFIAIAIEAAVLNTRLELGRKLSMQYAATVNLLTTTVGWMVFFVAEPLLPDAYRKLLMEYVLFGVIRALPASLLVVGFGIFLATFVLKLQGMEWLEMLLEKYQPAEKKATEPRKFKGRHRQRILEGTEPNRPLAVLWANAFSFTAITVILAIRILVDQPLLNR